MSLNRVTFPEFPLTPDGTARYGFDWSRWLLTGETIADSHWSVTEGVTLSGETTSAGISTVYVQGGEAGKFYRLTCTVTTVAEIGSRTKSASLIIACKNE